MGKPKYRRFNQRTAYKEFEEAADQYKGLKIEISEAAFFVIDNELNRFIDSRLHFISPKGSRITRAKMEREKMEEGKDFYLTVEKSDLPTVEAMRQMVKSTPGYIDNDARITLDLSENSVLLIINHLDRMIGSTTVIVDKEGKKLKREVVQFLEEGVDFFKESTRPDLCQALKEMVEGLEDAFTKLNNELVTPEEMMEPIITGEKNVKTGNQPGLIE